MKNFRYFAILFLSLLIFPAILDGQCNNAPDLIIYNGNIITMDVAVPYAEAMAIKDGLVMQVGNDNDIISMLKNGCGTQILNVQGLTIMPGFNDAHSHWFSWREHLCTREGHEFAEYPELEEIMNTLSYYGWTSISELAFGGPELAPEHLANALDLDQRGLLSVRLNGYWGNYDQISSIDILASNGITSGQAFSDRIRAPGIKINVDDAFGTTDILSQTEVTALVKKAHNAGWSVAAHCVNESAVEMTLNAFKEVLGNNDNGQARHRIEHAVKVNDRQLGLMAEKGIITCFQLIGSDEWPLQETFQTYLSNNNTQFLLRWKDMFQNAIPMAGSTDAPFNNTVCDYNPFRAVHQGVTRIGYATRQLEDWELNQKLTIGEVIRSLTVGAAYGTGEEDVKGSLAPGRYADYIVVSDDPLSVNNPDDLLKIKNHMTVVGGEVEYCALDFDNELCNIGEGFNTEQGFVSASNFLNDQKPEAAFDGDDGNNWGAGDEAPQWIQIDFKEDKRVQSIELLIDQFPEGNTTHEIYAWSDNDLGGFSKVHTFNGFTRAEQWLSHDFAGEGIQARMVKVLTTSSPSWVSWREIRVKSDQQTSTVDVVPYQRLNIYPLPWKDILNIEFDLNRQTEIKFELINIEGQRLKIWDEKPYASGKHVIQLYVDQVPDLISGNYILSMVTGDSRIVKKVTFIK